MTFQPPSYAPAAGSGRNETYLVWSILNLIFCCLPLGVVALIFSVQAQSAYNQQRLLEGQSWAQRARTCNLIATIGGVVLIGIWLIFGLAVFSHAHA